MYRCLHDGCLVSSIAHLCSVFVVSLSHTIINRYINTVKPPCLKHIADNNRGHSTAQSPHLLLPRTSHSTHQTDKQHDDYIWEVWHKYLSVFDGTNDAFNKLFADRLIERAGKCADKFSTLQNHIISRCRCDDGGDRWADIYSSGVVLLVEGRT